MSKERYIKTNRKSHDPRRWGSCARVLPYWSNSKIVNLMTPYKVLVQERYHIIVYLVDVCRYKFFIPIPFNQLRLCTLDDIIQDDQYRIISKNVMIKNTILQNNLFLFRAF